MNEIYWITRLDMINNWLVAFAIISGAALIISWGILIINYYVFLYASWDSDKRDARASIKVCKPIKKYSMIVFLITLLLSIFTPTQKEALMIYGVGGTIDYIKSNGTIKELPDKCVNALDAWVDSLTDENKEK